MARGGARNRSGPRPDPSSGRSDARGYSLKSLPSAGYDGPVPDFPLPEASTRELEVWEQTWRTPQACAWSLPSESWRTATVAMWVRVRVRCEDPEAPASLFGQLHRFADQIGMTTAGLAEMGWAVATDEPATSHAATSAGTSRPAIPEEDRPRRERRLRAVPGDQ